MRKIIALLLAACMLAGLPVVSFGAGAAAPTIGVSFDGYGPDDVIHWRRSMREPDGQGAGITITSDKKPVEISTEGFREGFFKGIWIDTTEENRDGQYISRATLAYGQYTESDVGVNAGTIHIGFEGGEEVVFDFELEITEAPVFKALIVDENGKNVLDTTNGGRKLPIGKCVFKLEAEGWEVLKDSGISSLSAKIGFHAGNTRIRVNGEIPDNERITMTPQKVDVADINSASLPFALEFETKTNGMINIDWSVWDENDSCIYRNNWGFYVWGEMGIIDKDKLDELMETPSDGKYTIPMEELTDQNIGLDKTSFETIWEKAGGAPVEITVGNGVSLTFDTAQSNADFLNALGDEVYNPSVDLRMPSDANDNGFTGGQWIDFVYSGRLPGKVKIKVPVETAKDVPLTLWYYRNGKAEKQEGVKVTVEEEGGKLYAFFEIDHCSAYALYPTDRDPNPVKNTSTNTTPSPTGGGSSSSDKSSTAASVSWSDVRTQIRDAKNGETVFVTLTKGERLSASVVRALAKAEGVTLRVRCEGETLYISSEDAAGMQVKDYSWKELLRLFGTEKEEPSSEADDTEASGTKPNPGTGAYPLSR